MSGKRYIMSPNRLQQQFNPDTLDERGIKKKTYGTREESRSDILITSTCFITVKSACF